MLQKAELPPTPWLTLQEAAGRVKMSPWMIRTAAKRGELAASGGGYGRKVRIHVDELDAWMRRRGQADIETLEGEDDE